VDETGTLEAWECERLVANAMVKLAIDEVLG
jgi:hypothetical protein